MVNVLDSESSRLDLSHGQRHCVVFLGKTLYSPSASLHPGTRINYEYQQNNAGGNPLMD